MAAGWRRPKGLDGPRRSGADGNPARVPSRRLSATLALKVLTWCRERAYRVGLKSGGRHCATDRWFGVSWIPTYVGMTSIGASEYCRRLRTCRGVWQYARASERRGRWPSDADAGTTRRNRSVRTEADPSPTRTAGLPTGRSVPPVWPGRRSSITRPPARSRR